MKKYVKFPPELSSVGYTSFEELISSMSGIMDEIEDVV